MLSLTNFTPAPSVIYANACMDAGGRAASGTSGRGGRAAPACPPGQRTGRRQVWNRPPRNPPACCRQGGLDDPFSKKPDRSPSLFRCRLKSNPLRHSGAGRNPVVYISHFRVAGMTTEAMRTERGHPAKPATHSPLRGCSPGFLGRPAKARIRAATAG